MKREELTAIKKSNKKELMEKAKKVRSEIMALELDKVRGKLTDFKSTAKKKKELAQVLTILRQIELLDELSTKEVKDAS